MNKWTEKYEIKARNKTTDSKQETKKLEGQPLKYKHTMNLQLIAMKSTKSRKKQKI